MTDVVTHAEIKRTQVQLAQLQADIAAARQEIANVQVAAAGSVIKSIQRGTIQASGVAGGANTVTVSAVNPSKAALMFLGGNGRTLEVGSPIPLSMPSLTLSGDGATVTASWLGNGYALTGCWCNFQLVEYY